MTSKERSFKWRLELVTCGYRVRGRSTRYGHTIRVEHLDDPAKYAEWQMSATLTLEEAMERAALQTKTSDLRAS